MAESLNAARLPLGWCHRPNKHVPHAYEYMGAGYWCHGGHNEDTPPESLLDALCPKGAGGPCERCADAGRCLIEFPDDRAELALDCGCVAEKTVGKWHVCQSSFLCPERHNLGDIFIAHPQPSREANRG